MAFLSLSPLERKAYPASAPESPVEILSAGVLQAGSPRLLSVVGSERCPRKGVSRRTFQRERPTFFYPSLSLSLSLSTLAPLPTIVQARPPVNAGGGTSVLDRGRGRRAVGGGGSGGSGGGRRRCWQAKSERNGASTTVASITSAATRPRHGHTGYVRLEKPSMHYLASLNYLLLSKPLSRGRFSATRETRRVFTNREKRVKATSRKNEFSFQFTSPRSRVIDPSIARVTRNQSLEPVPPRVTSNRHPV